MILRIEKKNNGSVYVPGRYVKTESISDDVHRVKVYDDGKSDPVLSDVAVGDKVFICVTGESDTQIL